MGVINFFKGHPTNSLMPSLELLELSKHVLSETFLNPDKYSNDPDNRSPLQYGTDPGNLETRQVVLDWINRDFHLQDKLQVKLDYLNLTGGASYGIMNCLAQCTSPHNGITKKLFIVTPTYYLINGAFIDAGFGGKLAGVLEKDDGQIDLDDLTRQLEECEAQIPDSKQDYSNITDPARVEKKIYKYVIYLIPTFSNPKGGVLSEANRVKLIQIARQFDMLVLSDDVYELLDYSGSTTRVPRLTVLDRATTTSEHGNTVSNGTFSKLICPGLRAGWQETASELLLFQLSQGGANRSGGTPSQLNISLVEDLIKTGSLDKIIENFKVNYLARAETIKALLKQHLPAGTKINGGEGGYFLWVTMPEGIDAREMCRRCKERNVVLASGDEFEVTGDVRGWGKASVRLSISYLTIEQIQQGVEIWGEVVQEMTK